MISKSEFQIAIGKKMINYTEEPLDITLSDANLKIAISWEGTEGDVLGDQGSGNIKLHKFTEKFNSTDGTLLPVGELDYFYHLCSEEEFPPLKTEIEIKGKNLYCFDNLSLFNVSYKNPSESHTRFTISGIKKCNGKVSVED